MTGGELVAGRKRERSARERYVVRMCWSVACHFQDPWDAGVSALFVQSLAIKVREA